MTVELTTDYLIIGAGAMGMQFLEEIILNSKDIEAVIVDMRDKPGGHWNDAYSFVRLHQPAITYGLNSRPLGVGDADLASKSQILSHFELGLADLLKTGRVKFLSQCKYQGDGKVVSLLDKKLTYKINYRRKLVNATLCETKVPSSSKPNFEVAPGTNFMPINGLSGIKTNPENFLIVGGGKTGIDAVLYLLDHGVDPDKLMWIIPNDSWFFNRDNFTIGGGAEFLKMMKNYMNALLNDADQTWHDVYKRVEEKKVFLRLDENIEPKKNRYASVSTEEIYKLRKVKNVVRKGRVAAVDGNKVKFVSGEIMDMPSGTVIVDCSQNGTIFQRPGALKKVFEGKQINVQFIMLPPPGYSTTIIAALELKYPEDEDKKNSICHPIVVPQNPEDYFTSFQKNSETQKAAIKDLGFRRLNKNRCDILHHISFLDKIKLFWFMRSRETKLRKRIDMFCEQIENETKSSTY